MPHLSKTRGCTLSWSRRLASLSSSKTHGGRERNWDDPTALLTLVSPCTAPHMRTPAQSLWLRDSGFGIQRDQGSGHSKSTGRCSSWPRAETQSSWVPDPFLSHFTFCREKTENPPWTNTQKPCQSGCSSLPVCWEEENEEEEVWLRARSGWDLLILEEWNNIPRKTGAASYISSIGRKTRTMGCWRAHDNPAAAAKGQIPAWTCIPPPAGRLDSSCRAQGALHGCPERQWGAGAQAVPVHTVWIRRWASAWHLTAVPSTCFYLGRANGLEKYFRISPHAFHRVEVGENQRVEREKEILKVWLMHSVTWSMRQTSWNCESKELNRPETLGCSELCWVCWRLEGKERGSWAPPISSLLCKELRD